MFLIGSEVPLKEETVEKISNGFFELLKTELPEEAQCTCVVEVLLEEIKGNLNGKKLCL